MMKFVDSDLSEEVGLTLSKAPSSFSNRLRNIVSSSQGILADELHVLMLRIGNHRKGIGRISNLNVAESGSCGNDAGHGMGKRVRAIRTDSFAGPSLHPC